MKSWFLENKQNQETTSQTKKKVPIKLKNKKGDITTDTMDILISLEIIMKQLYAKKLEKLHEMDMFLKPYNLLRFSQEVIENLNRPITSNKIKVIIKKVYRTRLKNRERTFPNSFLEARITLISKQDKDTFNKQTTGPYLRILMQKFAKKLAN